MRVGGVVMAGGARTPPFTGGPIQPSDRRDTRREMQGTSTLGGDDYDRAHDQLLVQLLVQLVVQRLVVRLDEEQLQELAEFLELLDLLRVLRQRWGSGGSCDPTD